MYDDTGQFEYSDTARKAAIRQVWAPAWLEKNRPRILRACGVANIEDESPEAIESARAFVRMMESVIERSYNGEYSTQNLELAFQTLIRRGLLAEPPVSPAPKPKLYYLTLHPVGAPDKTLGPFSAQDAIARARYCAREMTSVTIRDQNGVAVDADLEPLQDDPLARTQQAPQPAQPPRANVVQDVYDQEYRQFFRTSRTDAIKSRMRTDKNFASWVANSGQLSYQQASSGGVDGEGRAVEPKKL